MALHAHGDEAIHASAVLLGDAVVAFCGRSQTGKSTVAYGLHRRGCRVWADDTLVFDASADIARQSHTRTDCGSEQKRPSTSTCRS